MTAPASRSSWYAEGVDPDYAPASTTLTALFADWTARFAGRVAIDYNDRELSYEGLARDSARVAAGLRRLGIGKGDVVALYLPNTVLHPIFFFGVLQAGAAVTHLSPLDAVRELEHKLRDSGARLLVSLTQAPFAQRTVELLAAGVLPRAVLADDAAWGGTGGPVPADDRVLSWEALVEGVDATPPDVPVTPQDPALLQYTGGTTGLPKAAVLTHEALAAAAQLYRYAWEHDPERVEEGERGLSISPLFHIMGLSAIMIRRLATGGVLILHQRFELEKFVDAIERKRPHSTGGVPTLWIAVANMPGVETRDFSSLRSIGAGGAPLAVETWRRIKALTGLGLRGGWGMTEIGAAGTMVPAGTPDAKMGTIGLPIPGIRIEIVSVDDPRRVLPAGETGEMRIKSPTLMSGYHNNPQETADSFVDGWFLTGDIGYADEDGFLYLVDRKKDLILSGGYNVYPLAVEHAVLEHPDVVEAMVIGLPDDYRGESAWAYVVLRDGAAPLTIEALRAFLDTRLGRHELPQGVEIRQALPRTAVGKYSRKTLRDEVLNARAAG